MPASDLRPTLDSPRLPPMGTLSEVPEEGPPTPGIRSPYLHHSVTGSATTFKAATSTTSLASAGSSSRTPTGARTPASLVRSAASRSASGETLGGGAATPRRQRSRSPAPTEREREKSTGKDGGEGRVRRVREGRGGKADAQQGAQQLFRIRHTPHLSNIKDAELAPATLMHWSRAPVFGQMPARGVRSHTVTLVDNIVWLFGGWDGRTSWQEVFCFNTETMQWTYPKLGGDIPKPCRAHTATLVDRKIYMFGGGEQAEYYNDVYVLDTVMRQWHRPVFRETPEDNREVKYPPPRRSHTAVLYANRLWIFGGGTGTMPLNDLWSLDLSGGLENLRWEQVETKGKKPRPRGYHTANLIGNVMVIIGGGDSKDIFSDIWCLNLDTLLWSVIRVGEYHQRLGHTATQVGSYLFIFGGHDGRLDYRQELHLFNLVSLQYEPRMIAGKPPVSRGYHAACLADSRVFIFGGFDGAETLEDVCILDLAGAAYLPQVTSFRIDV